MKFARGTLAVLIAAMLAAVPAAADARDQRRGAERERHKAWRGDIHRFHEHDLGRWRAGRWHHGNHGGRLGWWWIVGGLWYFYPAPVYPYPDPYVPPVVVAPAAAQQYWYYCSSPAGYYPYVAQCSTNWLAVPPSPAPAAPPPTVQATPAPDGGQYWYYCADPAGYYPTIAACPGGWRRVPASASTGASR